MNNASPVISCQHLTKSFHEAKKELIVLDDVAFDVNPKQTIVILGASGAGKSTFLHLLGGLDRPTSGKVLWSGEDVNSLSEHKKCVLRNKHLGFIYQFHHLLPEFTALENVAMPLLIGGMDVDAAKSEAQAFIAKVGLQERESHKIGELSGGERQRIAIARALVTRPHCVLADEPTGNLDQKTAAKVFKVMLDLQQELGTSFVIVTHNLDLARQVELCFTIEGKQLVRDSV